MMPIEPAGMSRQPSRGATRLGALGRIADDHPTASFVAFAYAISWALWVPLAAGLYDATRGLDPFVLAGGFGPPVAAVVVTWLTGGSVRRLLGRLVRWRVHPGWYLAAIGLPLLTFTVANTGLYAALGAQVDPGLLPERLGAVAASLPLVVLLGGGQEELGWRGFALPQLQRHTSPLGASLLVGVVWACWHLPLFFTAWASSSLPFVAYLLAVVGMSVLFTWVYNGSGGSVLLVMLMHGLFNSANGLLLVVQADIVTAPYPLVLVVGQVLAVGVPALLLVAVYGRSLGPRVVTGATDRVAAAVTGD